MEKAYWLGRKRASLRSAKAATCSEARLIHYDLAGRYSLNAISEATQAIDLAASSPRPNPPGQQLNVNGRRGR
jgi:hypothetical protein